MVATALGKSSLEIFAIAERDPPTLGFSAAYNKRHELLDTFFDCSAGLDGQIFGNDITRGLLSCFQTLIQSKIKRWNITLHDEVGFRSVWTIVVPLFQES